MSFRESWFTVEQGMYSPRDNAWGFRLWGHFADLTEAKRIARRLGNARVLKVELQATVDCVVKDEAP